MKGRLLFIVYLLFLSFHFLSAEFPFRTWTSSSGVRIQARLISKNGDKLTIERSDSKQFVFSLSLLSVADQNYVRSAMEKKPSTSSYSKPKPPSAPMQGSPETLPIWSPAIIEKWWFTHQDGDFEKLSNELLSNLRAIWTTKEERSLREGRDFFSCGVVQSPCECPRCDLWLKRSATKVSAQVVFTPMQSAQPHNPTNRLCTIFFK